LLTSHRTDSSQTSANAMLTAKASKVLARFSAAHGLDDRQLAVLRRAGELLGRIVAGSLLIENRQLAGVAASHVGLAEYERAISAARTLNLLSQDRDLSALFDGYRGSIMRLTEGNDVAPPRVNELTDFLAALSEYFYSDLTRPSLEDRSGRFTSDV
jgi:hypothetical protein